MPFKLRLKKSRQYNVVSKSLFVICIELLDSSSTECTLTSESTGRECLENVCQRLSLAQTEFFGLRYISKNNYPRWIELDRPLKRQLDKYSKTNGLYLRVMYYINNIGLIQDEITRYHYFLQLKNDVIEGRIQCSVDDAIILASYCMQAEFGNYNNERHTPEYLKDFVLFPKDLIVNGLLERLTNAVIQQHSNLIGLSQGTAEEYYILAAQQLEGYGQETFLVKDEHGLETILGITLKGIIINNKNSTRFYKWNEIVNVINHKKNFGIECQQSDQIVNFVFPDVESAKYVWRMCVHQHTFFMSYEQPPEGEEDSGGGGGGGREVGLPVHGGEDKRRTLFENIDASLLSSHEELDEPLIDSNLRSGYTTGSNTIGNSREDLVELKGERSSNLDLVDGSSHDIDKLRSLLPSYRPAPDYETAVQQKYKSNHHHNMYNSQPDINSYPDVTQHYTMSSSSTSLQTQKQNLLHTTYSTPDLEKQMYMLHVFKSPPPYPICSNSTPDLASQSTPDLATLHNQTNVNLNNGGPNTTVNAAHNFMSTQYVSGSSPDLVSTRNNMNHSFVPNYSETHRTYANLANLMNNSSNGTMFDDKNLMYHHILNNNNSEANTMLLNYLKNKTNLDVTNQQQQQQQQRQRLSSNSNTKKHEPIYENVPLPWQQQQQTSVNSTNEQTIPSGATQQHMNQNTSKTDVHKTNSVESSASRKSSLNSNIPFENVQQSTVTTKSNINRDIIANENSVQTVKDQIFARNDRLSGKFVEQPPHQQKPNVQSSKYVENVQHVQQHHLDKQSGKYVQEQSFLKDDFVGKSSSVHSSGKYLQDQFSKEIQIGSNRAEQLPSKMVEPSPKSGVQNEAVVELNRNMDEPFLDSSKTKRRDDLYRIEQASSSGQTKQLVAGHDNVRTGGEHDSSIRKISFSDEKVQVPNICLNLVESDRSNRSKSMDRMLGTRNKSIISGGSPEQTCKNSNSLLQSSTISHMSTESANSATNTVDKKKKKWSDFLSTSGHSNASSSSSKSNKTNTLPKHYEDRKKSVQLVSKETLCQIFEQKLADEAGLLAEFNKIPKVPKTNFDYGVCTSNENGARNRYRDILPYEENRVRLTPKKDNKYGYINASHINAIVGNEQRYYIAAQSPLTNTIEHFWEMIWETNVYLVINLNATSDSGSSSSVKYVPDKINKGIVRNEFKIVKELEQESGHCITCKLKLCHNSSKRYRNVWYLEYVNWSRNVTAPDDDGLVPGNILHFLGFLEEISSIREYIVTEIPCAHNKNPPILIHCLDGVEKTGLTILCDLLLYLMDHNEQVDIPKILLSLRNQRMNFVLNRKQYTFVYRLLITYLKQSRLI